MNNRGNALFLILIGVALFAALSYAITQSGRGSGNINKETEALNAAQMVQYMSSVRTTVQRLLLTGTPAASLDLHTGDAYTTCSTGVNCVFAPDGGGATKQNLPNIPDEFNDKLWRYSEIGDGTALTGIGTTAADSYIYAYIKANAAGQSLCQTINRNLGITGIPGATGGPDWWVAVAGVPAGCVTHYNTYYIVYQALIEN